MAFATRPLFSDWRRSALIAAGIGLMAVAPPVEAAVTFSISDVSFSFGTGYGVDGKGNEKDKNSATLLGIDFKTASGSQTFGLSDIGSAYTFTLGTAELLATEDKIDEHETNGLDLFWVLGFDGPPMAAQRVDPTEVRVNEGPVVDNGLDFAVRWSPMTVDFGEGGQFRISLNDLEFYGSGLLTQTATITLLALPDDPAPRVPDPSVSVPEPGSLALVALGLAGIGATRRRRFAA